VTYIGNWDDVGAAKQAARALIEQNCDVIFPNADAASLGAFQAAQEKKVIALGANKNQNDLAPDVILASGVIDIPTAFLQVAEEVQKRSFQGHIMRLGIKEGVISLVYNAALKDRLSLDVQALLASTQEQIVNGSLLVPTVEFNPVNTP